MSECKERAHWVRNIMHNSKVSFGACSKSGKVVESNGTLAVEIRKRMKAKYGWDWG